MDDSERSEAADVRCAQAFLQTLRRCRRKSRRSFQRHRKKLLYHGSGRNDRGPAGSRRGRKEARRWRFRPLERLVRRHRGRHLNTHSRQGASAKLNTYISSLQRRMTDRCNLINLHNKCSIATTSSTSSGQVLVEPFIAAVRSTLANESRSS